MRPLRLKRAGELRAAVREARSGNPQSRYLERLICCLLVAKGRTCYEVAEWLGESPRSVELWIHRYRERGLAGLRDQHRLGGSCRMTSRQLSKVRRDLARVPREPGYAQRAWTGRLLQRHLAARYHVRFSMRHCQRLLHRLPG